MSPEEIQGKIKALEAEIVGETNDPDHDLALRTELQSLRDHLKK